MKTMKKLLTHSLTLLLLAAWSHASAQDRALTPDAKSQPASSTKSGTAKEKKTDTVPVQTDAQNRTYIIVDGRKIFVDSQGVQYLVNPEDSADVKSNVKSTK